MKLCLAAALAAALAAVALPVAAHAQGRVIGQDAAACAQNEGPAVEAEIIGLKDRAGDLKLELYPANEQDFLKDDRDLIAQGKVFHRVRVAAPASGPVVMCIRVPKPGRYALLFTHNRDGKNKFSFWGDGAGFAANGKIGRARPKLAQALIDVGAGVTKVAIRAQYLRGFGGFGPLGGND